MYHVYIVEYNEEHIVEEEYKSFRYLQHAKDCCIDLYKNYEPLLKEVLYEVRLYDEESYATVYWKHKGVQNET